MSKHLQIHDAFAGFGEKKQDRKESRLEQSGAPSQMELEPPPPVKQETLVQDMGKYPSDASNSNYPIKVRCPKCNNVSMTRMSSEMGAAAWVWCILLSPFVCVGFTCLCFDSCRDKIHFCTRCNHIVGKNFAKVC